MRFSKNEAGRFFIHFGKEEEEEFIKYLESFNTDKTEDVIGIDVKKIEIEYAMIVKGRDHLFEVPQDVSILTVVNGKIIKQVTEDNMG